MYTTEQILSAAKQAELSEIDAKHLIEVLVKMNQHPEIGTFRKIVKEDSLHFSIGEIVQVIEVDDRELLRMKYRCINKNGIPEWIFNSQHEPTTETF